ncbi:MAG: sigma 54-interacting transcriptional regulator [candidate division WOR-3 bacterium]|nr:MAG: sigma 54-interacting transcriptional regulator [candidate division WOR-3 bacterium]
MSEYIEGKPIHELFKGFSQDFLAVIMQVMNALSAFHNKGFIHTDLKPEHILYDSDKRRAVLIDFGFAGIPSQDMKLAGTMGYIAPEVLKGVGIDQRSDLYSLGVIIYEILSGRTLQDPFVPIQELPGEINDILARLISKEPALRPTIPELYQTFSKYLPSIKIETPTYQVALPETGFVEIPEVIEKLRIIKDKALIITGDIGSGKTRLLKEMKFQYLMDGYAVLFYISSEKNTFHESLQNFVDSRKINFSEGEDKFHVYEEITRKLLEFAKDKKVVIMVDDLENLSVYELALFRYIGYGIEKTNILLIGTSKPDERIDRLGFDTISLRCFTIDEMQKLIEKTFFEIAPAGRNKTKKFNFVQWLHQQSGGNPLFIVEILKTLYKHKAIYYQTNKWQIKSGVLNKIVIPTKLEDLLKERLKDLTAEEFKILKIICLAGHPLERAIISSILKSEASINIEHIKNLGLLKEEFLDGRRMLIIPNYMLIQVVEKFITKKEKQRFSKSLIETMKARVTSDQSYVPILAQLSAEIDDTKGAYGYYQRAAEHSEAMYDYDAALRYYEKGARYYKKMYPEKYGEFLIKIGDLNRINGNNEEALDYYSQVLKSGDINIRWRVYKGLGYIYSTLGEYGKAVKYFRKALHDTEREDSSYIKTANPLGYALANLFKFKDAEMIFSKSIVLARKLKDKEMEANTLYHQASLEWFRNDFEKGIKIAKNLLMFCEKHRLTKQYSYCALLLSSFYQQMGNIDKAQQYFDYAVDGFSRINYINALSASLNNSALMCMQKADIVKAKELFEEALMRSQQIENRTNQYVAAANLAGIYEDLGRFQDALTFNRMALEINPDSVFSNYNLSMVYYKKGECDKAKRILEEKIKTKKEILYYVGLAMLNAALTKNERAEKLLNQGLELIERQNPITEIKIESFLKTAQFYCENRNFGKSLEFSKKIVEMIKSLSREYILASAFQKINKFNLRDIDELDITHETTRLKEMGCIYDYAYLTKLRIKSILDNGIREKEIKTVVDELRLVQEICESIGAGLELDSIKKLQEKIYPIVVEDYSRRVISIEYLDTFAKIAELINAHLGDKDFTQNILDIIIQSTNAERGALFLKTPQGMEFVAGRDMDHATLSDASELTQTAIKELDENEIVFVQDALSDPQFCIKKSVMLHQIRSLLCIPLSVSGNVIGALYLDSRFARGMFRSQDKNFLLTVAQILASVIEKSIAFQKIAEENILLKSNIIQEIGGGYLMGASRTMKEVYRLIDSVAETNAPVLILGETGTGKGMVARLIHLSSKRKNKRFLTINCGTIPETLLESELFGHKKGAFTGAISDKKGLLEEAEAGTIFLDEITNTSLSFQAKLLEAIEEKIIRRVGETTTRNIDVRFLFATNKDLEIEVEETRFRKDLFYRINVFRIEVPPLRDRIKDIPLLAQFFLERYSKEMNKNVEGYTREAMRQFKEYFWPGNVRELQNVIERAVVLTKGRFVTAKDLGFEKMKGEITPLKVIKKEAIVEALNVTDWHVTKAAEILGINRKTIQRYIKKYKIKK